MKLELILCIFLLGTATAFSQEKYKIIIDGKEVWVNVANNQQTESIATPDYNNYSNTNISKHTVKAGETLYSISRLYNISVNALCTINNIAKDEILSIGEILNITNFANPSTNTSNASYHIVKKGDTLYSLARRYGISIATLQQLNDLDSNLIFINQRLKLN